MSVDNEEVKALLLALTLCATAPAQDALYDRFFDDCYFQFRPSAGTAAGFHQYDDQLEDYARASVDTHVRDLQRFERVFARLPVSGDRDLVLGEIRSELLDLASIRGWEKDPNLYPGLASESIFSLMSRKFAPEPDRLRSVIAREKRIPALLGEARANLKNPPRVYTEVAIEQLPGIAGFFQNDVPKAFTHVTNARLLREFHDTNTAVIQALNDYTSFLKTTLLPQSNGDYRIGAENYRRKLLYDEMVDTPLDQLLKAGYADLRKNQQAMKDAASRIDPHRDASAILTDLLKDHPAPGDLLASVTGVLAGLRDFIEKNHIVTIPSPVLPIVEDTPPFDRALTTASMDTPGPFETVAKEAYFNVTPVEPGWPKDRIEEHMQSFSRAQLSNLAAHEAYPGHYVQFLWAQKAPSKTRKLLGAGSNSEGWAHYCEQMMLDEGYGGGDPKLRLAQVQDALLRDARYIVGIRMHTGDMSFDQAVAFFIREAHTTHEDALVETKRGTSDPTYLVYTLGKLEIMRLREDYRKLKGSAFRLQDFHDAFLEQGFPPIPIVRRDLLGEAAPLSTAPGSRRSAADSPPSSSEAGLR